MRSLYKILHTTCHTQWGPVEKRIFNESIWMEKNGHKIIILAPKDTPLFLKAKEHGFKVYGIEFRWLSIIKDYKLLKQLFYNEKPDIINTHGKRDSMLALYAGKKTKIPLRILSQHTTAPVRNSWFNRVVYKKLCHYIFTTTEDTSRHLRKVFKFKDMQIFSMPSGIIEPDHLLEKNEAKKMLAQELGLDSETKFIGFVGKASKDMGIPAIFEAFQKIKSRLLDYHVVVVGEVTDEHMAFLQKHAMTIQIDDHIHFTGFRKELWPFYRALDCTILSSQYMNDVSFDGIRQTLLESMICECPVIVSNNSSIIDIIDHEKTGLLFNNSNPSDLADKILQTLQDENATKKCVETARNYVKKHHTIDAMGRNIIRIYRLHQVKLDRQHL